MFEQDFTIFRLYWKTDDTESTLTRTTNYMSTIETFVKLFRKLRIEFQEIEYTCRTIKDKQSKTTSSQMKFLIYSKHQHSWNEKKICTETICFRENYILHQWRMNDDKQSDLTSLIQDLFQKLWTLFEWLRNSQFQVNDTQKHTNPTNLHSSNEKILWIRQ